MPERSPAAARQRPTEAERRAITALTGAAFPAANPVPDFKKQMYTAGTIRRGPRRDDPRTLKNSNERVRISTENTVFGGRDLVVCEDLAYAFATAGSSVLDHVFQSRDSIKAYFESEQHDPNLTTKIVRELEISGNTRQLVGNKQFGSFLADFAKKIQEKGLPEAGAIITTSGHAMSVRMQCKPEDDKEARFAFSFYDPNQTGLIQRMELPMAGADPLASVRSLAFTSCFERWQRHFPRGLDANSTWGLAIPLGDIELAPPTELKYLPREQRNPQETVTAAITGNMPALLRKSGDEIAKLGIRGEQAVKFLEARKSGDDYQPGLKTAAERGCVELVRAYGDLLRRCDVPKAEALRLLKGEASDGDTALHMVAQEGHEAVVRAYHDILKALRATSEQVVQLLGAKASNGDTALHFAARKGHGEVIKALGKILKETDVPREQVVQLLGARAPDGVTPLYMAAEAGHADVIKAFGKILKASDVPREQVVQLLGVKVSDDVTPLIAAAYQGHGEVIKAFGEILKDSRALNQQVVQPVGAKSSNNGATSLYMAARKGHGEVIKAFGKILKESRVTSEQVAPLLGAKASDGATPLIIAAQRGHGAVVEAFGEVLDALDIRGPEAAQIFSEAFNGTSPRRLAEQRGHTQAVAAYDAVLRHIDNAPKQRRLGKLFEKLRV